MRQIPEKWRCHGLGLRLHSCRGSETIAITSELMSIPILYHPLYVSRSSGFSNRGAHGFLISSLCLCKCRCLPLCQPSCYKSYFCQDLGFLLLCHFQRCGCLLCCTSIFFSLHFFFQSCLFCICFFSFCSFLFLVLLMLIFLPLFFPCIFSSIDHPNNCFFIQ